MTGWPASWRRKRSKFHTETFVCSVRGHVAPAATVGGLGPTDSGIGLDLPDGRRMARCLRCDVWVAGTVPASPSRPSLPPITQLERPRRGRELRQALLLRLIALDRALHSVAFAVLAIVLTVLEFKLGPLQHWAETVRKQLASAVDTSGRNPSRSFLTDLLDRVLRLRKNAFPVLIVTAIAYSVVEGVEAVGLWLERRWAEYLTALATAGFLPFEIHELVKRVTGLRIGALVVNIAVLVYLVWSKRLFGIGRNRPRVGEDVDLDALFGPPVGTSPNR